MSRADGVGPGGRHPDVAVDTDQLVAVDVIDVRLVHEAAPGSLRGHQRVDVQSGCVDDAARGVRRRDQAAASFGEEPGRVHADRTEPLYRHPGAVEVEAAAGGGHIGGDGEPEPGGAQLVERDAAQFGGRPTARPISSRTQPMAARRSPCPGPGCSR